MRILSGEWQELLRMEWMSWGKQSRVSKGSFQNLEIKSNYHRPNGESGRNFPSFRKNHVEELTQRGN